MRICIVSIEYPPFHGGGIGTYSANLSRALSAAGHEVHVITNAWCEFASSPVDTLEQGEVGQPRVQRLDVLSRNYSPRPPHADEKDLLGHICRIWEISLYWSLHAADAVAALHRRVGLDIVEFPECFAEGYIPLRRRLLGDPALDLPVTLTLHTPIFEVMQYNRYRKSEPWFHRRNMMEEYGIRHADRLCSPSQLLATTLRRRLNLQNDTPIDVIYNPMDLDAVPPVTTAARVPPELLFVGRLEPRKGCDVLVDAVLRLLPEFPQLTLRLVGRDCLAGDVPGHMRDALLARIPPHLQRNFIFAGLIPREQVVQAYAQATACVFPAPWDNFPYTCCEAMAAGACVIAGANTGMAEMIQHGTSGLLFPAGDTAALAAAIRQVLTNPELRSQLGKAARPAIRALTDPAQVVEQRIAHYQATRDDYHRKRRVSLPGMASVPSRPLRLSVQVFGDGTAMAKTVTSVKGAANRAEILADITEASSNDGQANLATWLEKTDKTGADYLLRLDAGCLMEPDYLRRVLRVLSEPRVGWATSWARPVAGERVTPYAGFDFSLPLELLYHHPVPFAVIRREAFAEVGGWNLSLPPGWREWDLWLALHQAGWRGVVLPEWLAEYLPSQQRWLDVSSHARAHEAILECVVRRNEASFKEHAADLWVNLSVNPQGAMPRPDRPFPPVAEFSRAWIWANCASLLDKLPRWLRRR